MWKRCRDLVTAAPRLIAAISLTILTVSCATNNEAPAPFQNGFHYAPGVSSAPSRPEPILFQTIVYFEFDSDSLSAAAKAQLDDLIEKISPYNILTIGIVGYTDSMGTDVYNEKLSKRRADAVMSYLVSKDINPVKFDIVGKGNAEPIAPNIVDGKDNPAGRKTNRRAEVRVEGLSHTLRPLP